MKECNRKRKSYSGCSAHKIKGEREKGEAIINEDDWEGYE